MDIFKKQFNLICSLLFYFILVSVLRNVFSKIAVKFLILFVLLFFHNEKIDAYPISKINQNLYISSKHKDFDFFKIKTYMLSLEKLVLDTFGLPLCRKYEIYIEDLIDKGIVVTKRKKGIQKIYFNSDYSLIRENNKMSRTLIQLFVLSTLNFSYTKENVGKIRWLVGALSRKNDRQAFPAIYPYSGSFPGLHNLLLFGYRVQPDIIINNYVFSTNNLVNQINSEADEILLDSILTMKNGPSFLVDYFKTILLDKNEKNIDVFYSILGRSLGMSKKKTKVYFIDLLNDIAFCSSVNLFMPASVQYMNDAFKAACVVSYSTNTSPVIMQKCQIEDLPKVWDSLEFPDKVAQNIKLNFMRIDDFSTFGLKESISGILGALSEFMLHQNGRMFTKDILLYKNIFAKALIKEMELQKLLRNKESKHVRIPARFDRYFKIIDADDQGLKELWPRLNNYLAAEFNINKR